MIESVLIVGLGAVGKSILFSITCILHNIKKIGIISTQEERINAIIMDLLPSARMFNESLCIEDAKNCVLSNYDICFIACGVQYDYVTDKISAKNNYLKIKTNIRYLIDNGYKNGIVIVSNPNDALTSLVNMEYASDFKYIIGTGTMIDECRYKFLDYENREYIKVIGKHGVGAVLIPDNVQYKNEVASYGSKIVTILGHADLGISLCCVKIIMNINDCKRFIASAFSPKFGCAFSQNIQFIYDEGGFRIYNEEVGIKVIESLQIIKKDIKDLIE